MWGQAARSQTGFGRFIGEFKAQFNVPDNNNVTLLSEFTFVDPDGLEWRVPEGVVVNGASIPRALWSIVGSPYTGNYRRAAAIHDHFCGTKERTWQETHYVFYLGSRADGVSEYFGKLLYGAVLTFGPRWKRDRSTGVVTDITPSFDKKQFEDLQEWIETQNPSVQDINGRVL